MNYTAEKCEQAASDCDDLGDHDMATMLRQAAQMMRRMAGAPDGYAVVMPDPKSAPRGYWFVAAYTDRACADELCAKQSGCSVRPFVFAAAPEQPK